MDVPPQLRKDYYLLLFITLAFLSHDVKEYFASPPVPKFLEFFFYFGPNYKNTFFREKVSMKWSRDDALTQGYINRETSFYFLFSKKNAKKRFNIDYYGPLAADSSTSLVQLASTLSTSIGHYRS
jgi:hypothetical protein